jgi:hypothetical protein
MIPVFEREKTVHASDALDALDLADNVIGIKEHKGYKMSRNDGGYMKGDECGRAGTTLSADRKRTTASERQTSRERYI